MPPVPLLRTLRDIRVSQGLRVSELANRTGMNRGTLSMIERGRMVASPEELRLLADALGLDRLETRSIPVVESVIT